jgi:hypothetical protein
MEKFGNYLIENSKTYKSDLSWPDCSYNNAAMRILNVLLTPQIKEEIDEEITQYLLSNISSNIFDEEWTWEITQKSDVIPNSRPYHYEK